MRPIDLCFPDPSDPEACRKAYIMGYRAGYIDGQRGGPDITRQGYDGDSVLCEPIESMKLSYHAYNCLNRIGCRYVDDVVKLTAKEILRIRGMGKKTAQEISRVLAEKGMKDTEWDFVWLTG